LFAFLAEAQLGKALASVVSCLVEALAWPAPFIALAGRVCALWADGGAGAGFWKFLWRLAKADRSKAVACLVLCRPA